MADAIAALPAALTEAQASLSVMTKNAASMAKVARDVRAERDALIEGRDMMGRLWEKEKAEAAKLRLEVQHALDTADAAIAGQKAAEAERDAALAEGWAAAVEAAAQVIETQGDSAATEALGQRLCCNGHMCGCGGATVEKWLLHLIHALTPPADIAPLLAARDARVREQALREALTAIIALIDASEPQSTAVDDSAAAETDGKDAGDE